MLTSGLMSGLQDFLLKVLNLLPDSPFVFLQSNGHIYKYLQYINWIVPIDFMLSTLTPWLTAVALYLVWSVGLRWFRAIE